MGQLSGYNYFPNIIYESEDRNLRQQVAVFVQNLSIIKKDIQSIMTYWIIHLWLADKRGHKDVYKFKWTGRIESENWDQGHSKIAQRGSQRTREKE